MIVVIDRFGLNDRHRNIDVKQIYSALQILKVFVLIFKFIQSLRILQHENHPFII